MSDEQTTYPIHVDIMFHITDGSQIGEVTYGHGMNKLPREDQMEEIIATVTQQLPPGFRLMDRAESGMYFMREKKGYRGPNLVIPKLGNWFDPSTDKDYTSLNDEPDLEDEDY